MAKYQIIVESDEFLPDDEFQKQIEVLLDNDNFPLYGKFKLLYVNNLQGIRKELWEKKEQVKDAFYDKLSPLEKIIETVEQTNSSFIETKFDEIADLFKLD